MKLFQKPLPGMLIALIMLSSLPLSAQSIPDFTFLHVSDGHSPIAVAGQSIAEIAALGDEIELTPYNVKVDSPSFIIDTGDITEFGAGEGWDIYADWWKSVKLPRYTVAGNHDNVWFPIRDRLKKEPQGNYYWSFDKFGCHFIGLDLFPPHEPRIALGRDQLLWLGQDLAKLKPETPVFLAWHDPLHDPLFGSPYAVEQVLDMLRPYNLVALLYGHGHSANYKREFEVDCLQGGSLEGPIAKVPAGFCVISVKDGILRDAYKILGEPTANKAVLEKPMPTRSSYPTIEVLSPKEKGTRSAGPLIVKARISGNEKPITEATWTADNLQFDPTKSDEHPMEPKSDIYEAEVPYTDWAPGAHYIRVTFVDDSGARFTKSVGFYIEPEPNRLVWRTIVGGSVKGSAAVTKDTVYVGATDGKLYALRKNDGRIKWMFPTGGGIIGGPLVVGDTVYIGSEDHKLYAVGINGNKRWEFEAKESIYSPPIYADGAVIFGSSDHTLYAVDAKTGKQRWAFTEPTYTIESKAFADNDIVYFGAWDTFVYAVDLKTGQKKWACQGHYSTKPGPAKYYSPADCGPVVAGGKVFIADRGYDVSIIDAATGQLADFKSGVSGTGLSEDGKFVYLRGTGGNLTKIDTTGQEIWSVPAGTGSLPTAPVEKDGVVYVVSNLGLVRALNAPDGNELWKYQATPTLHVMSGAEVANGVVYITGMDGSVTALKAK